MRRRTAAVSIDSRAVSSAPAQALGVGLRGPAADAPSRCARRRRRSREQLGIALGGARAAGRARATSSSPRRASRSPRRSPRSARPTTTRAPRTRSASPTSTSCAASAAASSTRPTSSRARATRATSSALLEWCSAERVAAIPYGGGTSVVGGVTPEVGPRLQRRGLDRPRRARPRARGRRGLARGAHPGAARPARRSRRQLGEHGLTLRHFPQSFEFSTLGGWIATRAGGHFATRLDAHRGLRRVGARDHAGGRVGVAAAARLGRRRRAPTGCSSGSEGTSA